MSKSKAEQERDEIVREANSRNSATPDSEITFGSFVETIALPFCRSKWKRSTAATTENRIRHHLIAEFGEFRLAELRLKDLQMFLNRKADTGLSRSVVAHLRWDLHQIFKVARAEGHIVRDPTQALYTPRGGEVVEKRTMTREEVRQHIAVLALRERVIDQLAIFVGMRPGEILALQRKHVNGGCTEVRIAQRLYRGYIDTPKGSSHRTVAIPPATAELLRAWVEFVESDPDAWVFASENRAEPLWRDNVWYRHMKPKLDNVGLGWANFQVMRRTHASLGHDAGIDPKVAADQRGHGIGVSLDVYTKASMHRRAEAGALLETAVFAS
jgi:integrase